MERRTSTGRGEDRIRGYSKSTRHHDARAGGGRRADELKLNVTCYFHYMLYTVLLQSAFSYRFRPSSNLSHQSWATSVFINQRKGSERIGEDQGHQTIELADSLRDHQAFHRKASVQLAHFSRLHYNTFSLVRTFLAKLLAHCFWKLERKKGAGHG
jgi:hypothetical protein